jgi:hypothetical protein
MICSLRLRLKPSSCCSAAATARATAGPVATPMSSLLESPAYTATSICTSRWSSREAWEGERRSAEWCQANQQNQQHANGVPQLQDHFPSASPASCRCGSARPPESQSTERQLTNTQGRQQAGTVRSAGATPSGLPPGTTGLRLVLVAAPHLQFSHPLELRPQVLQSGFAGVQQLNAPAGPGEDAQATSDTGHFPRQAITVTLTQPS